MYVCMYVFKIYFLVHGEQWPYIVLYAFYPVFNLLMFYILVLLVVLSFTQLASTVQANILASCTHIHACHMHDKKLF